MNTHILIADMRQDVSRICEGADNQNQAVSDTRVVQHFSIHINCRLDSGQVSNTDYRRIRHLTFVSSVPGVLPPSPPRIFFGRGELVEKIVRLSERLTPIALIGTGGIGKTAIALTALHDDRIRQRFGEDRRFIRCGEFPATRSHFLRRLSKVVGAGIENPENLGSLRPFISSEVMLIVLDNAESILDPQGPNAREIYADVAELIRLNNICIWIISRISIIPPGCETFKIPTLSTAAASDTFYRIYKHGERSGSINDILERLDFHPLSITLLATVAQQSRWDTHRLAAEWEARRTGVRHSGSLATTIELSLSSLMFQELGPDARPLLEVVAFFPQGIDEMNTSWLFPTISGALNILDGFRILSLAYLNNGFVTMLAPLRDHLRPKDPTSSQLLNATKEIYFTRLSDEILPGQPGFGDGRWITTEDVNVEHLLDVFATVDPKSRSIWDACIKFMAQLYWHKSRLVTLGPRIEALADDHPSKPECLSQLARLFDSVGNLMERKRLLSHSLKLWREQGDDFQVAETLGDLSNTNWRMGLYGEGILQAKEASEISKRFGYVVQQADYLIDLTRLLCDAKQLDAAVETGSRAINLLPEKGEELQVCQAHRVLGNTYQSKGETKKAIHHFEVALQIASPLNVVRQVFWINFALARLFSEEGKFEDAQTHLKHAKAHAINDPYLLAYTMDQQARVWYGQRRLEEARSEASRALDEFKELGAAIDAEFTRRLLQHIDARSAGQ